MSNTPRYEHHERLMTRLADANGVDLDLKLQKGELCPDAYETYVQACTGCSDAEGCRDHISSGGVGFPSFCRNADTLGALSEATPSSD